MATRRYRKRSKKSLKKRVSRRRKNVRSSRRMRGGLECKENKIMGCWGNSYCKYNLVEGKLYQNSKDTKTYKFISSKISDDQITHDNKKYCIYEYVFKDINPPSLEYTKKPIPENTENNNHKEFMDSLIELGTDLSEKEIEIPPLEKTI